MESGMILHLTGFAANTTREDIKELLDNFGTVAWIDFVKGDSEVQYAMKCDQGFC